jgi:hypothetical protein
MGSKTGQLLLSGLLFWTLTCFAGVHALPSSSRDTNAPFGSGDVPIPWKASTTGKTWSRRVTDSGSSEEAAEKEPKGTFQLNGPPQLSASLLSSPARVNSSNPHFRIKFACDAEFITAERCMRAEAAFVRAADRISSALDLSFPIDVSASFESFCGRRNAKQDTRCKTTNSVLGSAAPAAFYDFAKEEAAILGIDADFMYPTALAKQFLAMNSMAPGDIDIAARFNADFTWWIDAETDGNMAQGDYDLEEAITHELLHGMGFISSWFAWLGVSEGMLTPSYVTRDNDGAYMGFAKEYIFNKYVSDNVNGVWMSAWAETIRRDVAVSVPVIADWTAWVDAFKATPAYNLTRQLFLVAQSDVGLAFWYNDSVTNHLEKALLYTPAPYSGGSSVSHLDATFYEAAPDWLMRPYAISGARLDDIRPRSAEGSGTIGDITINMLRTFGYRTRWDAPSTNLRKRAEPLAPNGRLWIPPDRPLT